MLLALSIYLRTLVVALAFAFAPSLLGFLFFGWKGAAFGAGVGMLALVLFFFIIEEGVIRALGASARASVALQHTLERALEKSGLKPAEFPRVLFFQDAGPTALYVRAPFSLGAVLLSQGLVASLDEAEFRAVFEEACARTRDPGVQLRSLCFWAALWLARMGGLEWSSIVFLGAPASSGLEPRSALRFAAAFPWIRFFVRLASLPRVEDRVAQRALNASAAYGSALRKIELSHRIHGSTHNVATGFAGLVNLSLER